MNRIALVVLPFFFCGVLPGQNTSKAKAAKRNASILALEKASQADKDFRQLQSILLLFEEGWIRNGMLHLGNFYKNHPQTKYAKLLAQIEDQALRALLGSNTSHRDLLKRARALLIGLRSAKLLPVDQKARREAINRLTPRVLAKILQLEAKMAREIRKAQLAKKKKTSKKKRPILQVLIKNAGNGLRFQKKAAQHALLMGDKDARKACYRLVLRYPKGPTRKAILNLVRQKGLAAEAVPIIGQGFTSKYPLVHYRAARALGELGSKEALPLLKKESFHLAKLLAKLRKRGNGGAGPRANISVIKQQAIVRDYEIQVAQNSAVADPVVDVVSEGVVLDVKVLGVSIIRHLLLAKREVDKAYHSIK
jgi:hypothetical protein